MTTGIEFLKPEKKRKGRGLGKKPALMHMTVRVPKEVAEFLEAHYPYTKQAKIREILTNYVNQELSNGNS